MRYFLATIIAGICFLGILARAHCVVGETTPLTRCTSLAGVANLSALAENISRLEVSCAPNETVPLGVFSKFNNLVKLELHECNNTFDDLLPELPFSLHSLNAVGNGIRLAPWQRFQHVTDSLDLRGNPLACDCANRWILVHHERNKDKWDPHVAVKLPTDILFDPKFEKCDFEKCPFEDVKAIPSTPTANLSIGNPLNLRCHVNSTLLASANESTSTYPFFIWPYNKDAHQRNPRYNESWNPVTRDMSFELPSLTSTELGYAVCICQWCSRPAFDKFELRFPTNLSVVLEEYENDRDTYLKIHGYPLDHLRLSVTRLVDNVTEDVYLSDSNDKEVKVYEVFGSLIIKSDPWFAPGWFLRLYKFIVKDKFDGSHHFRHIDSDYAITVCRANDSVCVSAVAELVNAHHTHERLEPLDLPLPKNEESTFYFIVVIIMGFAIVILVILFSRSHIKRELLKKGWELQRRRISRNTDRTEETSIRLEDYSASNSMNYIVQHVPIIEKDTLEIKERIGKGAFGEVYVGDWYPKLDVTTPTKVAVKKLFNVQLDSELDKEAALLAMLDHPNIVKLFGIARGEGQISLIMEMMNLGDLKTFVRDRAPRCDNYSQFPPALIPNELLNIAGQVAAGLAYLASQNIVHRDLAGRNCLVQGESDLKFCNAAFRKSITVKISDFGMSRRLFTTDYYKMQNSKTVLPVRWLPPECLSLGKFTHQSDMWSFGMVLYEIFSYGAMPYGDLSNSEVVSAVMSGARPQLPSSFPEPINALIEACWRTDPELRITASEALNRLGIIA